MENDDWSVPTHELPDDEPQVVHEAVSDPRSAIESHGPSRIGATWAAVGVALVLLVLLVVFILQNQAEVEIKFFGFSGTTPVGVALLVAAVAAGILVGIAGAARVHQLSRRVKRASPS